MGPGEIQGPVGHARVVVFFHERQRGFPAFRHAHDQVNADGFMRAPDVTVRRNEMMGSSTEPVVLDSGAMLCIAAGSARVPPRPINLRAVGFAGDFALLAALPHHQMQQPGRLFLLRSGRGGCREWRRRGRKNSVCTNRLLKAGCAASAAGSASTTSA